MLFLTLGTDMARPSRTGGKKIEAKARSTRAAKGRKTTKTKPRIAPAATRVKRRSVSVPSEDLMEAREQQAATAEILKVIASSPSDVQPVFDAIASSANRLIGGFSTAVYRVIDDIVHLMAFTPTSPEADEALKAGFPLHRKEVPPLALVQSGETAQIADAETADPQTQRLGRARGWRSVTFTPLMSQSTFIGFIVCTRRETGVLANHHVQLLRTFADQAVIAIENTRLFNETQEALERQTATAEILKVIASSPSDTAPVFEAIAGSAKRLLGAFSTAVFRFVGGTVHLAAFTPTNPAADEALRNALPLPADEFEVFQLAQQGEPIPIPDTEEMAFVRVKEVARLRGFRSILYVPLMNGSVAIGVIAVTRIETGPFATHHIELLQTFADQAVIAIENVRLFNETQEALEHQTATSEVLQVIGRSMTDTQPVFERILDSTERLFDCRQVSIFLAPGDGLLHVAARRGTGYEAIDKVYPLPIEQTSAPRVLGERRQVYFPDVMNGADVPSSIRRVVQVFGNFSVVMTPMIWEGQGVGLISVLREPNAVFTPKELSLLRTFADQAVIAIENVRLFNEVQAKTADLSRVAAAADRHR